MLEASEAALEEVGVYITEEVVDVLDGRSEVREAQVIRERQLSVEGALVDLGALGLSFGLSYDGANPDVSVMTPAPR